MFVDILPFVPGGWVGLLTYLSLLHIIMQGQHRVASFKVKVDESHRKWHMIGSFDHKTKASQGQPVIETFIIQNMESNPGFAGRPCRRWSER